MSVFYARADKNKKKMKMYEGLFEMLGTVSRRHFAKGHLTDGE